VNRLRLNELRSRNGNGTVSILGPIKGTNKCSAGTASIYMCVLAVLEQYKVPIFKLNIVAIFVELSAQLAIQFLSKCMYSAASPRRSSSKLMCTPKMTPV
jgi:hypothetical protein